MRATLAVWRVSLHRTLADWPIVAAAWLITLLAATLLAGATIYPAAAAEAGLRRALVDAPAADVVLTVSRYTPAGETGASEALVQPELQRVLGAIGGTVNRDWRSSATLALPERAGIEDGDQAILGALDGLAEHATLVDGAWPATSGPGSTGPLEVAVVEPVARELALGVGDVVPLVAHATDGSEIAVRVVGVFAIDKASDPFWAGDEQLLLGIHANPQYRTYGPFLTTPDDLLASAAGALRQQWRVTLRFEELAIEEAGPLRARIAALPARLVSAGGAGFEVRTELQTLLGKVERSLLVSRTGVLLLVAQLLILAAYAIVLTASLLVDHRRVDTALLRSRGAGPLHVASLALAEGLVLAVPAVLLAPWLAVGALEVLNAAGPLAEVGIRIAPRITSDAYLGAGIAGLGCVVLLVLPAFLAARSFAAEQGGLSRQETRTFGQRMGLDLALLAITGVALWQLRLYGAPLTRTVQGSLGIDPLLVAAPAIGMIAGAVLALRVLPLLAEALESLFTRGRDLVLSMGSRQLSRRPLRYTRSALLLMLAMSMGVFGLSYAATWSGSQRDQAAYQAGADLRVVPGTTRDAPPAWALPAAYAGLDGVEAMSAVERRSSHVSFASAGSSDVLALDAGTAPGIVLARPDESGASLAALLQPLRERRPDPALRELPAGTAYLKVVPAIDRGSLGRHTFDPETGEGSAERLAPGEQVEVRFQVGAVVRDGHGVLHRAESTLLPVAGASTAIVLSLSPAEAGVAMASLPGGARLDGPLSLALLTVEVWLPEDVFVDGGLVGVLTLAAGAGADGPWRDLPLGDGGGWRARSAPGRNLLEDVPPEHVIGATVDVGGDFLGVHGQRGRPAASLVFVPAAVTPATATDAVAAIANRAFLDATSSVVGDVLTARVEGASRRLEIVGVVETFPTTEPSRPLLVFDQPTLGLLRLEATGAVRSPDEWWLAASEGADASLSATLRAAPFASTSIVGFLDRTRSLSSDPVALGVIGAFALGFAVTGLFAVVGLVVSGAVSARQRRTEFALLRALGLSGRQLFGSLWLENGSVVLVSLAAGTGLGLLIGWIALPFITVTQAATAPVPPVIVEVPWDRILGLEVVSALALGLAVLVIGGILRRLRVGSVLRMGED